MPKRTNQILTLAIAVFTAGFTRAEEPTFTAPQAMEVVDTILERHIDPPTRQEMVLRGAQALLQQDDKIGGDLSRRISNCESQAQLEELLTEVIEQTRSPERNATARLQQFANGILPAILGGGSIVNAKEAKVGAQLAANRYVGIGIQLTQKEFPIIVHTFFHGSGYKAGVLDGDRILKIDGEPTDGKDLRQIVDELRGEEGTDVDLVLAQPEEDSRELTVTRSVTFIPTIEGLSQSRPGKWNYFLPSHPKVAYLQIRQFGPSTVHELKKIAVELKSKSVEGIILDVREGGGSLHDTILLADQLLEEGPIGRVQSADGEVEHRSQPGSLFTGVPMVTLVANSTGAGNVFVAAALQDAKRAKIVGQTAMADNFVRKQFELTGGERIVFATGLLRRADGTLLSRWRNQPGLGLQPSTGANVSAASHKQQGTVYGLVPDIKVPFNKTAANAANNSTPTLFTSSPWCAAALSALEDSEEKVSLNGKIEGRNG